jgi:hypothetical protein
MVLALSTVLVLSFAGTISAQQVQSSTGIDDLPGKGGQLREAFTFNITSYFYITAQANNPTFAVKQIRVFGTGDRTGYLTFSDDPTVKKRPSYNANTKTIYIYYPESFLPQIIKVLEGTGNVLCQVRFYANDHIWASVESPTIKRQ